MGKPSQCQLTKKSSQSLGSSTMSKKKMNVSMSSQKSLNKKRRERRRTKNNIKRLFDDLRNGSQSSIESANDSVIVLDDNSPTKSMKRKLSEPNLSPSAKRRNHSNGSIIVIADDLITSNTPCKAARSNPCVGSKTPTKSNRIQCSTPITKKDSKTLQDLIVSNFSKSRNNNTSVVQNFNEEVQNLTKEINGDSYVTVDLTTETLDCSTSSKTPNTVIDLVNTTVENDCTLVSASNGSLSLSGESDVTVLHKAPSKPSTKEMRKVFKGISKLDATEKNKMFDYLVKTILNGCHVPDRVKSGLECVRESINCATETVEDTYIKEVIIGQCQSRNSIGSNIYNPAHDVKNRTGLRMIVIDGSNVAMGHGSGKIFSVKGLKICIDYFLKRGHVVKAFVPRFRCKFGKSTEPRLLDSLERRGLVVYTPSREIEGKMITSYDDRYIVQCAAEFDGVIVSGDNFRDLMRENPRWKFVIQNRLLQFTWVNDMIMFPRDPLGRYGPTLEDFLRHSAQPAPEKKT